VLEAVEDWAMAHTAVGMNEPDVPVKVTLPVGVDPATAGVIVTVQIVVAPPTRLDAVQETDVLVGDAATTKVAELE
jgi:hypothetical protein